MFDSGVRMARLIALHLFEYRTAFAVLRRQTVQMSGKVALDLALGFRQKSQIPFVVQQPGGNAQRKGTCVP